jgi:hypothetical protein
LMPHGIDRVCPSGCQSYKGKCPFLPFFALLFPVEKNIFNLSNTDTTQ